MPYADRRDTRIYYQVEGDGPPLVLQHGFTGNLQRWYELGYVDALKSNYQLILVDARGHGLSDKPHDPTAYTLRLRVGDVVAVLDALGVAKTHYWGYSMGGWIGFGMAKYAASRVQSLVIGGAHPYEARLPASSQLDGSDPEAFLAALFTRLEIDPATVPPAVRAELLENDFRALAAAQQDRPPLEDILSTMTMPCCLYAGDADPFYLKIQQCAQQIPGAISFAMAGLDHGAAFRESGLALRHVIKFLHTITEAARKQVA
jgi:pimeloyl-ACP methyl ester carboxylesterase